MIATDCIKLVVNTIWIVTVCVPYLALIALFILIKGRGGDLDFDGKTVELGVESTILGVGVSAAVCGSKEFQEVLGSNAMGIALLILFFEFLIIALAALAKDWKVQNGKLIKSLYIIMLGAIILGINTALVMFVDERGRLCPTIVWGLCAFVAPIGLLLIIRWFVKLIKNRIQTSPASTSN